MSKYLNDPYWITARFGRCSICGRAVMGERVLYFPKEKKVQCNQSQKCAEDNQKVMFAISAEDHEY